MDDLNSLPEDLRAQFLSFFREEGGQFNVLDKEGLIRFLAENGERHPALLGLLKIDKDAVVSHFKETGEVLPGMKIIHTSSQEGSNVTKLAIHRGPTPPKASKL